MNAENRIGTYPFSVNEDSEVVRGTNNRQIGAFFENPLFANYSWHELSKNVKAHVLLAESIFLAEDWARNEGRENANLYYHCKEHTVYQTTFDTLQVVDSILKREDKFSSHLSAEGAIAAVLAAPYHDIGYVYKVSQDENYAARLNTHVEAGIEAVEEILDMIPTPKGLSKEKIKELVKWGIHATHFPSTEETQAEAREWLDSLAPEERKEAQIVRLAVQLGDLGGQVARPDYPETLKSLRMELNAAEPGLGDKLIDKGAKAKLKCSQFIDAEIEPTVGRSANAIFKSRDNIFSNGWKRINNTSL